MAGVHPHLKQFFIFCLGGMVFTVLSRITEPIYTATLNTPFILWNNYTSVNNTASRVATNSWPAFRISDEYSNHVILYAKYRTGSSFTGELFHRNKNYQYIFEPENQINVDARLAMLEDMLKKLLSCKFQFLTTHKTSLIKKHRLEWVIHSVFCRFPDQSKGCGGHSKNLSAHERGCKDKKHIAIKMIIVPELKLLLPFIQKGIKIVILIRDPRAVFSSRKHLGRTKPNEMAEEAKRYCETALSDVAFIHALMRKYSHQILDSFHFLRYEDLAQNTASKVDTVYSFLKDDPDSNLKTWAKSIVESNQQKSTVVKEGDYGVIRSNSTYTSEAWRHKLQLVHVKVVQTACKEMLYLFNYTLVDSQQLLDDESISLVRPLDNQRLFYP